MSKDLAEKIRYLVGIHNSTVIELENQLRYARDIGLEVDLLDGTNTEISHDLDGLTAFRIRVVKILAKMSL